MLAGGWLALRGGRAWPGVLATAALALVVAVLPTTPAIPGGVAEVVTITVDGRQTTFPQQIRGDSAAILRISPGIRS